MEHLARHSNFITREQEDADLTPDKLYIVERLSDFAVYENKFLYMLLFYLKSFIGFRYNKILELISTYNGSASLNKTVVLNKRKLTFEFRLNEEKRDDPYLKENNPIAAILERIDLILKTVMYLLSTPLMLEVAKIPMLKPPITKTNVLKMNHTFRGAVALYDFIMSYEKPGYSVESVEERIAPFPNAVADEFAETVMLSSFLTYQYGLGLSEHLEKAYVEEERRRREKEAQEHLEQLARVKKRVAESGCDPAEYILLLERRIRLLEEDSVQLAVANREIERLLAEVDALSENIRSLTALLDEKEAEIRELNIKHSEEIAQLMSAHEQELIAVVRLHAEDIAALNAKNATVIDELTRRHTDEIGALHTKYSAETKEKADEIRRLKDESAQFEATFFEKSAECEHLIAAKSLNDAQILALRKKCNLISEEEDFTSEMSFKELEHLFDVFSGFIKEEWTKTKKRIRKDIFKKK